MKLAYIVTCRYVYGVRELVLAAKAFADPTRVRILAALQQGELCVCELCDALKLGQSTLSTQLQVIRDAGLVETRRQGKWVYYKMAPEFAKFAHGLFRFFEKDMEAHAQIKTDRKRLAKRLAERENGACCRGFTNCC